MRPLTRSLAAAGGAVLLASLTLAACGGGSTVVVSGPDGGGVSINPSAGISISSSDGSIVVGKNSLPDGWPAEVGQPEGFTVVGSATTTVKGKEAFTATMSAEGDQSAAVKAWVEGLKTKGFTVEGGFGGLTGAGGIASLKSSDWEAAIISTVNDGKTAVVVNLQAADA